MYPSIDKLKAVLIGGSYISEDDSKAAEAASQDGAGYIDYLIRTQLLTKPLLGQALAEGYKLPFVDLTAHPVAKEQIELIPEATARELRVVIAKQVKDDVLIATDTPDAIDAKKLKSLFKGKIHLAYALPEAMEASFSLYERPLATRFSQIIESGERVAPEIVDEIIKDATSFRASDIHFEPMSERVVVRFRVDGTLREAGVLPKEYYDNVLNRIKVESGMRIDEHLAAQDGAIQRESGGGTTTDLRVSLVPTVHGEKVVMRVLSSYVQGFSLADIGLDESHRQMIEEYAAKPFGMILTTGPTGSGKTTTLYSLLKLLNHSDVNITTIEDPVEYKIAGVNQIQVREQTNMTFAKGLRAIVRQDPDIILVGEIRDQETANISVNAALTGHLLLSTFHANDAATAIPRLVEMGIEPFLLASTLEIVIAQRLVRKICPICRYSVPATDVLKTVKAPGAQLSQYFHPSDTLYAGKGCNACGGSGYQGRIALFQFIEVTPEMQELILKMPSSQEIETLARKQGSLPMFDDGLQKVKNGMTTLSELIRVVPPPTKR